MRNITSTLVGNANALIASANNIQNTQVNTATNSMANTANNSQVNVSTNSMASNSQVNAATNSMANTASNVLNSASTVNNAINTANRAINVASNVGPTASVESAVSSVVKSVQTQTANTKVSQKVVQAANVLIMGGNNTMVGKEAAAVVANAGVAEALNIQNGEIQKVNASLKSLNQKLNATKAKIQPQSPTYTHFANAVSVNKNAMKKMVFTTEGNIKEVRKGKNGASVINVNGTKRAVVPQLTAVKLNAHNKKTNPTGRQVYKQGELKNIYNKKNPYTVMNGAMGNMKSYLFKGSNGLFSGINI
tara:strand:- start:11998 stop:12915 length:918 start_codon:yes stop_codon:yes gene_type:complete